MRLSILDDYQGVALDMADWTPVRGRSVEIAVERNAFADEDAVVRALADSELVAAMRERTPFPKSVIDRLPKLKLLITTGMRNASFDMAALKDRGVTVCGTGGPGGGNEDTAELAWGLILGAAILKRCTRPRAADSLRHRNGIYVGGDESILERFEE